MKKVIIVTGDSSGIGRDLCTLLSKDNIVYGISRRPIEVNYKHYCADVLDYEAVKKIVDEIYSINNHIDMVICSAGLGIAGAVECMSTEDYKYQMEVNFNGVVNVDKAVIPYLREQGFGKLVHISSVAALAAMPFQSFYSASKAALNAYSMGLENELRPYNVKVLSIMPGDVSSGFTGARKKVEDPSNLYKGRVERSIKKMESDEQKGEPSKKVSKKILKIINKKHPRCLYTVGFSYKVLVFLMKVLPSRMVNKILYKIYAE